jgi:hypothetical protein
MHVQARSELYGTSGTIFMKIKIAIVAPVALLVTTGPATIADEFTPYG